MKAKIGGRNLGPGFPCYIVAEMSANHGGDFKNALEIVRAAKKAGADAVKLQTYRADTITIDSDQADFVLPSDSPWKESKTLYALYQEAYTPWEWHQRLFKEAEKIDIAMFSSPFDATAVGLLEELDCPAYKIASPEITDVDLLKTVARTGKPVIVSSGIANLDDLELALDVLRSNGCEDVIVLKCTSGYPAPLEEANLRTIPDMSKRFRCIAGYSDHTIGRVASIAAVALGANMIEKHFILADQNGTADDFFSMSEIEFAEMVRDIRGVERALGRINYSRTESAEKGYLARRSLYVCAPIRKGEVITKENVRSVRPGYGLHPRYLENILGRRVKKDLRKGDRLSWNLIEDDDN